MSDSFLLLFSSLLSLFLCLFSLFLCLFSVSLFIVVWDQHDGTGCCLLMVMGCLWCLRCLDDALHTSFYHLYLVLVEHTHTHTHCLSLLMLFTYVHAFTHDGYLCCVSFCLVCAWVCCVRTQNAYSFLFLVCVCVCLRLTIYDGHDCARCSCLGAMLLLITHTLLSSPLLRYASEWWLFDRFFFFFFSFSFSQPLRFFVSFILSLPPSLAPSLCICMVCLGMDAAAARLTRTHIHTLFSPRQMHAITAIFFRPLLYLSSLFHMSLVSFSSLALLSLVFSFLHFISPLSLSLHFLFFLICVFKIHVHFHAIFVSTRRHVSLSLLCTHVCYLITSM